MIAANKPRTLKKAVNKVQEKKLGAAASMENVNTKREAFNDLQNCTPGKSSAGKDAAAVALSAYKNTLKYAKIPYALRNTKARIDMQAMMPNVVVNSVATNAAVAVPVDPKLVENRAKLVNHKPKDTAREFKKHAFIQPRMRREDRNMSCRSLTMKATAEREILQPIVLAKKVEQSQSNEINDRTKRAEPRIEDVLTYSSKLLCAIDDIDANDSYNLILVSDYAKEIYEYLFSLECKLAIRKNHLEGQEEVYPNMRAILVDWVIGVHFFFNLNVETFEMAVAIIDLYLQAVKNTKRSQLQLVGITALFIASKYEEVYRSQIKDFIYIADSAFTRRQLLQMELEVLKALECNLSRPLPIHFLRRFSKAANANSHHYNMAKYFLDLVAIEYELAAHKPSEVAAASLYLALHLLAEQTAEGTTKNTEYWTPTLEHYSKYSAARLQSLVQKISTLARNAPNAKLKAVFTKYQSSRFGKVAMHPQLQGKLIDSIIASAAPQL